MRKLKIKIKKATDKIWRRGERKDEDDENRE